MAITAGAFFVPFLTTFLFVIFFVGGVDKRNTADRFALTAHETR